MTAESAQPDFGRGYRSRVEQISSLSTSSGSGFQFCGEATVDGELMATGVLVSWWWRRGGGLVTAWWRRLVGEGRVGGVVTAVW
jgi:hypothetical protein